MSINRLNSRFVWQINPIADKNSDLEIDEDKPSMNATTLRCLIMWTTCAVSASMLPDSAFAKGHTFTAKSQAEHQWISPFAIDTLNSEFDNGQTGFLRVQLGFKKRLGALTFKLFGDGIFLQPYGPKPRHWSIDW